MKYRYEKHDIDKLKKERRGSYSLILLISGIGIFAIILLFVLRPKDYEIWIVLSVILSLVSSYTAYYLINKQILLDLKQQEFAIITTPIIDKKIETDYEAGSGGLIKKMRSFDKYLLYFANNKPINLDKPVFDKLKIGDKVNILYSKNAKIFLRIEKIKDY